jgi:ribonuclease E
LANDATVQAAGTSTGLDHVRNEPRQDRPPRSERNERGNRPARGAERTEPGESMEQPGAGNRPDGSPDAGVDGRNDNRGGRGRNGRRGERAPRQDDSGQMHAAEGLQAQLGFSEAEASTNGDATHSGEQSGTAPPREGRSRDRYGRERRPRQERAEGTESVATETTEGTAQGVATPAAASVSTAAPLMQAPDYAQSANHATARMPRVTPFALPTAALQDIAQGSGLQWVNSDATRVAAAQAAIAAEAQPVHVPRERPAPVVIDIGPLILVETRRDLGTMTLPFETVSSS